MSDYTTPPTITLSREFVEQLAHTLAEIRDDRASVLGATSRLELEAAVRALEGEMERRRGRGKMDTVGAGE